MRKTDRQKAHNSRGRFEQWVKNPTCEANTISVVHGLGMDKISHQEGGRVTKGQSPFAISRGKQFEKSLFNEDAKRLKQELIDSTVITKETNIIFSDLRLARDFGPLKTIEEALEKTRKQLEHIANNSKDDHLIAGAVVAIPGSKIMLPEAILIIDAILIKANDKGLEAHIGEVKTYPDRDGYTSSSDLATARAQAGIYVHALRLVLNDIGLSDKIHVSNFGFLVLSKPGSNYPSLRFGEDLRFMALRAERGFEKLRKVADKYKPKTDEELAQAIGISEINYKEDCLSFCDRASTCISKLSSMGAPISLGHQMERFLGEIDLHRAIELIDKKSKPSNKAEADFISKALQIISKMKGA
jgi:hypothetical protein